MKHLTDINKYFMASLCVMSISVVACLSHLQAQYLHSWKQNSASASESGYTFAHFVTQRPHYRTISTAWAACSPSCLGWLCPCHAAVEMGVLRTLSDAQGSRLCLAYDRCLHFGMCSDRRREVLHSPHKRENLEASLPEQFSYSSSHSSSLHKVPSETKWQDKSFGLHYPEQLCGLWIHHAHNGIYLYHC